MTIQEAAEIIKYDLSEKYYDTQQGDALELAIRSLEAWEKAYDEISASCSARDGSEIEFQTARGLFIAECIVGKYMEEIEKGGE